MASVPYGHTFLIVGGECVDVCDTATQYSDEILQYDPETEGWLLRDEKMAVGKKRFGAVLAEDRVVDCA